MGSTIPDSVWKHWNFYHALLNNLPQPLGWGVASMLILGAECNRPFLYWKAAGMSFLFLFLSWCFLQHHQLGLQTGRRIILTLAFVGLWLRLPVDETEAYWETGRGCFLGAILFIIHQSLHTIPITDDQGKSRLQDNTSIGFSEFPTCDNDTNLERCYPSSLSFYPLYTIDEQLSSSETSRSTRSNTSCSGTDSYSYQSGDLPVDFLTPPTGTNPSNLAHPSSRIEDLMAVAQWRERFKGYEKENRAGNDKPSYASQPSRYASNQLIGNKNSLDKDPKAYFRDSSNVERINDEKVIIKAVRFADEEGKAIHIVHDANEPIPSLTSRVLVLLMIPKRQEYEFVGVEYYTDINPATQNDQTLRISQILRELPKLASDPMVAKQRFERLMQWHPDTEGSHELINALPIQSYDLLDADILIAIPKGWPSQMIMESAKVVLKNERLLKTMNRALRRKNGFCTLFPGSNARDKSCI